MKKFTLLSALFILTIACSSTRDKIYEGSSEVSSGISAIENAANTVDRAIATEKSIRERFDKKD